MRRRIFTITLVTLAIIAIAYLSKPDRGGVDRCASIFSLPEILKLDLRHDPFLTWDLFESSKFRFKITAADFEKLSHQLSEAGYSPWESGSLQFGSVLVGGSSEEDYIYCTKETPSYRYYWSYSAREGVIYAITFPT